MSRVELYRVVQSRVELIVREAVVKGERERWRDGKVRVENQTPVLNGWMDVWMNV